MHAKKTHRHFEPVLDNEIVVGYVIAAKPVPRLLAFVIHRRCSCERVSRSREP